MNQDKGPPCGEPTGCEPDDRYEESRALDGDPLAHLRDVVFPSEDSCPSLTDEDLKAQCGPADKDRCAIAFDETGVVGRDERPLMAHFYQPKPKELEARQGAMRRILSHGGHIIMPMRERSDHKRDIVRGVMEYLTSRVEPRRIIVVNDESADHVVNGLAKFWEMGAVMINLHEVLALINWDRLLPILALDEPPKHGKGMSLLGGMIAMYLTHRKPPAIIQHDADLKEADSYDGLTCLAYPLTQRTMVDEQRVRYLYVKTARAGRGNETCMTARNIIGDIATNPRTPVDVQKVAALLYRTLREHKWMCSGEFGLFGELAYNRPFATGYLEETLISIFVEECIMHHPAGVPEAVAHVEAPNARLDDSNDDLKEFRMQDRIARFLIEYCWYGRPIVNWALDDFQAFNERFGSCTETARIPTVTDDERNPGALSGPVIVDRLRQDRIIPGVKMLFQHDLVDIRAAREYIEDHQHCRTSQCNDD